MSPRRFLKLGRQHLDFHVSSLDPFAVARAKVVERPADIAMRRDRQPLGTQGPFKLRRDEFSEVFWIPQRSGRSDQR